jgi:hypothetical protein
VETGGVKAALQEMFPQELRSVIMGVAGAIGGAAVAAVAAFAVAMGGAIAAAAPFIAVGAALAVAAEYIWTNWDDLSRGWGVIWAEIVRLGAAGARNIINAVTRMVDIVADGWQRLMSVLGQSSDAAAGMKAWAKEWREIADEAQTAAEAEAAATNAAFREWLDRPKLPAEKAAAEKPDVDNLGLTFGSGMDAAATAAKGAADKIKREVDRITEGLLKLDEKTFDVANRFRQFRDDLNFQGTEGADRIYAEIDREKQARLAALTEFTDEKRGMFAQAEAEAAELQRRALSAGNAEAIARTAESLQTIKALREQAAQDAARAETEIDRQAKEKQLSEETWLAAAEAEIKKAMRDGDMESFYANLEAKKVLELGALDETRLAQLAALEEQRVVQQQYFDWEMESRTTMKEWTLGAMEEMKNGLSSAFADAITNGDKLGKSIANIGKQIANSFIQWQVSRAIAGAFGAAQDKKDAAKKIAALKSEAVVAWDLALAILIAHPGRGVTAVTEMGLTKTAGAGLNAIPAAANGAFVSAPTLMMVGEGRHPEGVFPLDGPIFDKFFAPLIGGGAAQVSATQNLYGDINTGSDEESLFEEWNYQLVNALRGA